MHENFHFLRQHITIHKREEKEEKEKNKRNSILVFLLFVCSLYHTNHTQIYIHNTECVCVYVERKKSRHRTTTCFHSIIFVIISNAFFFFSISISLKLRDLFIYSSSFEFHLTDKHNKRFRQLANQLCITAISAVISIIK